MSRELSDWLTTYLEYTENSEPPQAYHTWVGLSMIAGALQRKVYLKWGFEMIFPNMYVILIGPSGRARKGVAIGIGKDILKLIPGVSIAPESSSGREAMVLAMKRAIANFDDPTDGKVKFHCSLTAVSEELSVFLGQGDIKYLANLTDWFDAKEDWAYETIGRGVDALQGVCLNVLGATAPEWISSMLPQEAIGGGFTSRCIFVVETQKGKTIAKHQLSVGEYDLRDKLIRDLERISQIRGAFTFDDAGEKKYIDWYTEQDRLLASGKSAISDTRFAGYCERRATHLRKLMLLSSASRSDSRIIAGVDFDRALYVLTAVEQNMSMTFGGLGKSRTSDATERIMQYIQGMTITTRSSLLQKFYRDIDAQSLSQVEETLTNMRVISVKLSPSNGDKVYTWIGPSRGAEIIFPTVTKWTGGVQ